MRDAVVAQDHHIVLPNSAKHGVWVACGGNFKWRPAFSLVLERFFSVFRKNVSPSGSPGERRSYLPEYPKLYHLLPRGLCGVAFGAEIIQAPHSPAKDVILCKLASFV